MITVTTPTDAIGAARAIRSAMALARPAVTEIRVSPMLYDSMLDLVAEGPDKPARMSTPPSRLTFAGAKVVSDETVVDGKAILNA